MFNSAWRKRPPPLNRLAAPAAAGLKQVVVREAPRLLGTAAAPNAWEKANREAHDPLLAVVREFRGERLVDGGLLESIPYHSTLREGATHVLVLRSHDAGYRLPPYRRFAELALRLASPELVWLVRARPERYNREAEHLEALASCPRPAAGHPGHRPARTTADRTPRHRGDAEWRADPTCPDAGAPLRSARGAD
jgi:hypothetical protein